MTAGVDTAAFGIVTGLVFEARIIEKARARAKRSAPLVVCSGPGGERAAMAAEQLLDRGVIGLISFGLCAGLDPDLRPGTLLLAERVSAGAESYAPDPTWRARLAESLGANGPGIAGGALLGADAPIAGAEDKRALFAEQAVRALDMESHGVARVAARAGLPFVALRAVADPAERNLPRAALEAFGPDGRIKPLRALATMYLRPWESPGLLRLAYETRLAVDSLERAAVRLCDADAAPPADE